MNTESKTADPCSMLDDVRGIAREAGERILEIYGTEFSVEEKEDRSPLTAADMASHETIIAGLGKLTPHIPILSEESASLPFDERSSWQSYWLVDPLDGTREFIKRNGEFTVNIALISDGQPVMGIVYVPVTGVGYYACRGQGAHMQQPDGEARRITARKRNGGPVMVVGSRSHRGDSLNRFLENVGEYELLSMGSSLKICLVAEGKADVYPRLGLTSEWDTAAAQCVVEESGGKVTGLDMQPLRYNTKDSLLNPHFFVFGDDSVDWSKYL